jgi:hypothetical protein
MPKTKQYPEAAITAAILHLMAYREPNAKHAAELYRAAELWQRVARIQRRLGKRLKDSDWLRVPGCCGVPS